MTQRVLIGLAHDVSYHSVSCMLGAEEALQEAGCECGVWANPAHVERFPERTGPLFIAPALDPDGLRDSANAITSCDDLFAALGLTELGVVRRSLEDASTAIQRFRPNVVVADLCPILMMAAERCGVPAISTLRWAYHPANPHNSQHTHPRAEAAREAFGAACHAYGMAPIGTTSELIVRGARRYVIPSIPPFETNLISQTDSHMVTWAGPSVSARLEVGTQPIETTSAAVRVFVYWDPAYLPIGAQCEVLLEAFASTGWQIILAAAPGVDMPPTPSYLRVQVSPPGATMLSWSDLLITHGGSASLLQALRIGRPVVATPGDSPERQSNADVMRRLGRCVVVPEDPPSPAVLRESCQQALRCVETEEGRYWRRTLQNCLGSRAFAEASATVAGPRIT